MIQVGLVDSRNGNFARVNGEGELNVVVHPHPPKDETVTSTPFRQYFTSTGVSTGSSDMLVDGSSTNQEFYISADPLKDLYIKTVSAAIVDASAVLNKFGNLAALTNGLTFVWETCRS